VQIALSNVATHIAFKRIVIAPDQRWHANSATEIRVPIGLDSRGDVIYFALGKHNQHVLIGGRSGYGKSRLLDVLITQLALAYSPDELAFYLIDLKEGVAFQSYSQLPHARAVSLENDREFGLQMLRELSAEITKRADLFKSAQSHIETLTDYRHKTGKPLPRLILVLDEFQKIFDEDDQITRESGEILEDLARRGRSFGIHLMLASQIPSAPHLNQDRMFSQMGTRIAFQCDETTSAAILGAGNSAAYDLKQKGEAVFNEMMGNKNYNVRMRVALLEKADNATLVDEIRQRFGASSPSPALFKSAGEARLSQNTDFVAAKRTAKRRSATLWFGQPIALKPHCSATLLRASGANVLIAGANEWHAYSLAAVIARSLAAQYAPDQLQLTWVDFARPESDTEAAVARVNALIGSQSHRLQLFQGRQAVAQLSDLTTFVTTRHERTTPLDPTHVWFVLGIQRWREMRGDGYAPSPYVKAWLKALDEGPEMGVHTVVWTDTLSSLSRVSRDAINYFDMRLVLRLPSDGESINLLGTKAALTLTDNRALFFNVENRELEKFKPYLFE
jgi:hypothetical protein